MSRFQVGKFDREGTHTFFRNFCPTESFETLTSIAPQALVDRGFRLVLLDVDNTLLPWRSEDIPEATHRWIEEGRSLGLKFCLISNTNHPERLRRIAAQLGIDSLTGKVKPSREMYHAAMEKEGIPPEQTVMIGDQVFTDVWGANRSGVSAFLVRSMTSREFVGTKANRLLEGILWRRVLRVVEEETDDLPIVEPTGIFQRRIVRQFAKFCIVGGSSFAIDAGLHRYLMFMAKVGGHPLHDSVGETLQRITGLSASPYDLSFAFFKVISASAAILNSFYWNRKWTFGIVGKEDRAQQLAKFVAVSLVGLGLNVVIASTVQSLLGTSASHRWMIATIAAAAVVAIWNFSGQRLWAFRSRR